jgi:hypothetical protein
VRNLFGKELVDGADGENADNLQGTLLQLHLS